MRNTVVREPDYINIIISDNKYDELPLKAVLVMVVTDRMYDTSSISDTIHR